VRQRCPPPPRGTGLLPCKAREVTHTHTHTHTAKDAQVNVLATEGIAKSILREEIGAACFNAHAHTLLGRTKSEVLRVHTARRTGGAETKMSVSIELGRRNKRHGAPGGTGHLVACPLTDGVTSWLRLVTARRPGGHET
jgi:hypothetical protein